MTTSATLDRERLAAVHRAERERFAAEHPRSRELFERGPRLAPQRRPDDLDGEVGRRPSGVRARRRTGRAIEDVDGHRYVDFALGDTGAMAGHSPPATVAAVERRLRDQGGATLMLPTEDAAWVGEELGRRFGVPLWSFALTATDANRWVLRLCRAMTGRAARPRLQPLLPRLRRRDVHHARRRRRGPAAARATSARPSTRPSRRASASSTTSRRSSACSPTSRSRAS